MTKARKKTSGTRRLVKLRRQAESHLKKSPRTVSRIRDDEVPKLAHQLRVHQVELEMQNEELRRVQLELEISRDRFERLYDLSPVGHLTLDTEGVIREANLTAARLLGLDRRALLKKKLSRFIAPESQDDFYLHCQRVFTSADQQTCELQLHGPDGKSFTGRLQSIVEAFGRGPSSQCLTALSDVTLRLRAEEQLRELNATLEQRVVERTQAMADANERLHSIMESALIGIITLDERGMVEALNPAAAQIFGCTSDEIVGRNVNQWVSLPGQTNHEAFLAHYRKASKLQVFGVGREVFGQRKDGSVITLELTVTKFTDGGRRLFIAMLRDITARKRLERELLEISERERQRIGSDLHDGLGQHLHGLSYLAVLLEKSLREDASPRAAEVVRLNRYLEEALEMTRGLAHGLQPVKSVPEGLMIALRELADRTRGVYPVDCRFACRAPVLINRHNAANHLYRIAQEALNNAMKHGKPTRILIKLAATPQRLILGIRDNGVGIRRRPQHPKGMGLHVMQYRADAIKGSLLVQKLPVRGTEVVCTVAREAQLSADDETL